MRNVRCTALTAACLAAALPFATGARAATQQLIDAARKEGQVTWYTVQIVNQLVAPVKKAFEAKYGVTLNYVRGDLGDLLVRIMGEIKAGRPECDVFDGLSTVATLKREKDVVLKWLPDEAQNFPKERYDPDGYWMATYIAVSTPGINTDLVPKGTEPKTWEDLLDPKWKGKIAWSSSTSSTSGGGFVGTVLDAWGEGKGMDYLRKLSQQNIANLPQASRQVLDMVIAGEYAIALQISNHHAWISAKQGAPVAWLATPRVMVNSGNVSVAQKAPHPNAAKLLMDFLVSPEGQAIYRDSGYIPANPKVPPQDPGLAPDGQRFTGAFYTPEKLDEQLPKWQKIYSETFR